MNIRFAIKWILFNLIVSYILSIIYIFIGFRRTGNIIQISLLAMIIWFTLLTMDEQDKRIKNIKRV